MGRQDRGDPVARPRRRSEAGLHGDTGTGQQPQPWGGRLPGDDQDRGADSGRCALCRHPHGLRLQQRGVRGPGGTAHMRADHAGIGDQRQLHRRVSMFGREPGKRTAVEIRGVQTGDGAGRSRAQQHGGDRRPPAYEQRHRPQGSRHARPRHGFPRYGEGHARGKPGRQGGRHQPQVRRALLTGIRRAPGRGGRGVHRRAGRAHGVTSDFRSENRRSPMPLTSRNCSTDVKPPCRVR